jgi:hypothetical protein
MPAKSKINKLEALEATFGPLDPEDVSYINFLHARRHCATVPGRPGHRELAYVVELQELEEMIWTLLDRICERDGYRIGKEAAAHLTTSRCRRSRADRLRRGRVARVCQHRHFDASTCEA